MYARYAFSLVLVSCMCAAALAGPAHAAGTTNTIDKRQSGGVLVPGVPPPAIRIGANGANIQTRQTEEADSAAADPDVTGVEAGDEVEADANGDGGEAGDDDGAQTVADDAGADDAGAEDEAAAGVAPSKRQEEGVDEVAATVKDVAEDAADEADDGLI